MKITHPIAHPRTYFWYLKSNFLRKYFLYNQGDSGVPLVRDQEVGGSNPFAPTIHRHFCIVSFKVKRLHRVEPRGCSGG
jgi:hypothetical protein